MQFLIDSILTIISMPAGTFSTLCRSILYSVQLMYAGTKGTPLVVGRYDKNRKTIIDRRRKPKRERKNHRSKFA